MVEKFSKILILATLILNSKQALSSDPVGGSRFASPADLAQENCALKKELASVKADTERRVAFAKSQASAVVAALQDQVARLQFRIAQFQLQNDELERIVSRQARELRTASAPHGIIAKQQDIIDQLWAERKAFEILWAGRKAMLFDIHSLKSAASAPRPIAAPVSGPSNTLQ